MKFYAYLLFALVLAAPPVFAVSSSSISSAVLETRIIYGTQPLILDVRTPEEYASGHVPGAINIPHDQVAQRYPELNHPQTGEIVLYCRSGMRAAVAKQVLLDQGFTNVVTLEGHWLGWSDASMNVEAEPPE